MQNILLPNTSMKRAYRNIGLFFVFVFLIILAGFYRSYLGLIPDFKGLPFLAHIHFTAFAIWFALLIVQPFLIKFKKNKLHRLLGKASYFLVPIMVITAHEMQKLGYEKEILKYPKKDCLAGLVNTYLDIFFFVLFYIIAMVNKKKLQWHICFIVGTSLVLLSPGLGRLLFQTTHNGSMAGLLTFGSRHLVAISFLIFEKVKLKKDILKSPYLLLSGLLLLMHILFYTIPNTAAWQWIADKIVTYTY